MRNEKLPIYPFCRAARLQHGNMLFRPITFNHGVFMKPYIKSFFLILMLLPPLLAASALMISEGFSGNAAVGFASADFQWYFNTFI